MTRNTAREIAAHLSYELSFTDKTVEELLQERLTSEAFAELAEEDPLYAEAPNAKQVAYITRLVTGVNEHAAELDGYIAKYCQELEVLPHSSGGLRHHAGSHVRDPLHGRTFPMAPPSTKRWRSPKNTRRRKP